MVVHTNLYSDGERAEIERRLAAYQGRLELRYSDETGRVYALKPHSTNAAPGEPAIRLFPSWLPWLGLTADGRKYPKYLIDD